MNSPEFVFAWLGLCAIGASPAMINYHLQGKALLHCLGVAGARLLLVGDEEELVGRVEESKTEIEGRGMRVLVLREDVREGITRGSTERVGDEFREGVRGDWAMSMFYTSGTTGMPKGVPFNVDRAYMVSRGAFFCFFLFLVSVFEIAPKTLALSLSICPTPPETSLNSNTNSASFLGWCFSAFVLSVCTFQKKFELTVNREQQVVD